jgi:hypothetical protein
MPRRPLPPEDPGSVPVAPPPSAKSAPDGIESTRAMARRYLLDALNLFAAIAFARDSEASLFTKMHAAREVVALAGVLPPTTPQLPPPSHEAVSDGGDPS